MKRSAKFLLLTVGAACAGCATVPHQEVAPLPSATAVVSPTLADRSAKGLKRKVAIARFSNETKYGEGFFTGTKDERIAKQAMDIFSAKLASTNKFILLERADLDLVNKEISGKGLAALNIPADYLIVGSVSEFGRKDTSEVGVFSRTKKQTVSAKVNIRLVDVRTGQVLYGEEGAGEASSEVGTVMGYGSKAGYDASLNDQAISAAISKMISNVVENLSNKPWKGYVLSVEEGNVIMSGGKIQGVSTGDEFGLYMRGKTVVNPQTGIPMELPGKMVGRLKVDALSGTDATSEVSICTMVSGTAPNGNLENYYIQEIDRK